MLCCIAFAKNSFSQTTCTFTATVSGNTATFNHLWALPFTMYLDSLFIDYGDGNTQMLYAPVAATSTHTYINAGIYNACIIRYLHNISAPTVAIPCNSCITITIGSSTGCIMNANYTNTVVGLNAAFTSTSTCTGCSSSSYYWDFGDGSSPVTGATQTHTYLTAGSYTVCLTAVGTTSTGQQCTDSTCHVVTVTAPTPCTANAAFTSSSAGLVATFTNTSTCTSCITPFYNWDFGDASPANFTANPTHTYTTAGTYTVCLTTYGATSTGQNCSDSTCHTITVVNAAGVSTIVKQKIQVYPNPIKEEVHVVLPASATIKSIKVIDVLGREMSCSYTINSKEAILQTGSLAKGLYSIKLITTNKETFIASVIK